MQHDFYPVDLLDMNGDIVGTKVRKDINKLVDIFHTVHIILITPKGEVVMSVIPVREDLPNVYGGKMGTTVATIRRHEESDDHAADRAVSRELFIDHMPLKKLDTCFYSQMPPKPAALFSIYYGVSEAPESYSLLDIDGLIVMTPGEIDRMIEQEPETVAYSFLQIWKDYRGKLPL